MMGSIGARSPRPRRDDLPRSRAASPPPPVRHKVLGTTTATSNRHREMVDMQTPAPVPRGPPPPSNRGLPSPRRPASRANHGRRTAGPWVGQPPQIPQSGRRPPRLPPLTGPSPPQDKQRPACMPDCVHEHRPTTSPGSGPGAPPAKPSSLGGGAWPHEHKPTLPLPAGAARPASAGWCLHTWLCTRTQARTSPLPAGSPSGPAKPLGGWLSEGRRSSTTGERKRTETRAFQGTGGYLYASVHACGDTGGGVRRTT